LKGCNDRQDRCCFTPIAITFGAIELTVLCAFVCKVGYFDAQIRETLIQVEGFGLLASLG